MQARGEPQACERLLAAETLADLAQDGHLPLRPFGAEAALVGEREIAHVVLDVGAGGHSFSFVIKGLRPF